MSVVDAVDELSGVSIETHRDSRFLASVLKHIYMSVVDAVDELSGVNDIETLIERIVVDAINELSGVNIETLYKIVVDIIDELSGVNTETLYKIVDDIIDELSGVNIETLYKIVDDEIDELSGLWVFSGPAAGKEWNGKWARQMSCRIRCHRSNGRFVWHLQELLWERKSDSAAATVRLPTKEIVGLWGHGLTAVVGTEARPVAYSDRTRRNDSHWCYNPRDIPPPPPPPALPTNPPPPPPWPKKATTTKQKP